MWLTQEQLDEFHVRGFVTGGRVIDDATADLLLAEMYRVIEGRTTRKPRLNQNLLDGKPCVSGEATGPVVNRVLNIWEASEPFFELAKNPAITENVARLCNHTDTLRVFHDQIQCKPARIGGAGNWHQDFPCWPIVQPADMLSAWIALADADVENGCMWMVPGSHRWGAIQAWNIAPDLTPLCDPAHLPKGAVIKHVPVPVKKGHVSFHHCMTWHGSPENKSDRARPGISFHYMPGYTIYAPKKGGEGFFRDMISVKPGEVLQGDRFPIVYERKREPALAAAAH